jgi:ATPase subunit of ABC transporter with duplicated ATPase domains
LLTFSSVTHSFGGRVVLSDVDLSIPVRSRTALVGVNGSGKSTLLRLAAGLVVPDRGTVSGPPAAAIGYVPQDDAPAGFMTVDEYLRERAGVLGLERRLRALEQALAGGDAAAADAYVQATDRYVALGGYELSGRIDRAFAALDLPASVLPRPVRELSGGQQVRAGLAAILASRYALYLLDEPTNNLDLRALDVLADLRSAGRTCRGPCAAGAP